MIPQNFQLLRTRTQHLPCQSRLRFKTWRLCDGSACGGRGVIRVRFMNVWPRFVEKKGSIFSPSPKFSKLPNSHALDKATVARECANVLRAKCSFLKLGEIGTVSWELPLLGTLADAYESTLHKYEWGESKGFPSFGTTVVSDVHFRIHHRKQINAFQKRS